MVLKAGRNFAGAVTIGTVAMRAAYGARVGRGLAAALSGTVNGGV